MSGTPYNTKAYANLCVYSPGKSKANQSQFPSHQSRVSCALVTAAVLKEHTLKFHKKSKDGSGKCNAYYTGSKQDEVIGVVFDIHCKEKPNLDGAEGICRGYHEKRIYLESADGIIEAFMYEADSWAIDDFMRPYTWYKDFVVQGAREHGLPEDYIRQIEAVPADQDLDESRDEANRRMISAHGGWPIK